MKKQIYLLIALVAVSLVIGGLALAGARHGEKAIESAISAIGEVSYSSESKALIDEADEVIASYDPNLKLEAKVANINDLKTAKVKYVEKAIIRLYRAVRDKQDEDLIRQYLSDAESAFDEYLTEEDISLVHNYTDLTDAKAKYGGDEENEGGIFDKAPNLTPNQTTIDIC